MEVKRMRVIIEVLAGLLAVAVLGASGAGLFFYTKLKAVDAALADRERQLAQTASALATSTNENKNFEEALTAERARNDGFATQIEDLSGTVGVLDKLAKTDPELLRKYSKVYFLNENYVPPKLEAIDKTFASEADKKLEIHAQVAPFLEEMLADAKDDGIDLKVVSAYRSFGVQYSLKSAYEVTYGYGANKFSADQGYSEHQLGTTVDLTADGAALTTSFDATKAFAWLSEHAYRYGFVLSYPKGNAYYIYEPWHWRFVGTDLARKLHKDEKYFYDLDQRTIDEYLVSIFD